MITPLGLALRDTDEIDVEFRKGGRELDDDRRAALLEGLLEGCAEFDDPSTARPPIEQLVVGRV